MMQRDWGDFIGAGREDCVNEGPVRLCNHQQGCVTVFSSKSKIIIKYIDHQNPYHIQQIQNKNQACQEFALESIGCIFLGSRLGRIHHHIPICIIVAMIIAKYWRDACWPRGWPEIDWSSESCLWLGFVYALPTSEGLLVWCWCWWWWLWWWSLGEA